MCNDTFVQTLNSCDCSGFVTDLETEEPVCNICPAHGVCADFTLKSCDNQFVVEENDCVCPNGNRVVGEGADAVCEPKPPQKVPDCEGGEIAGTCFCRSA